MQRLNDTLRESSKTLSFALVEAKVFSVWKDVVGKEVNSNTTPQKIRDGILFIRTKNPSWAQELKALSAGILKRINEVVGANIVREIRFLHGGGVISGTDYERKKSLFPGLDSIKLTSKEIKQIEELVCDIKQDDLRQWLTRILIKDKKLSKWRDKIRQS